MLDKDSIKFILLVVGIITTLGISLIVFYFTVVNAAKEQREEIILDQHIATDEVREEEVVYKVAFEMHETAKEGVSEDVQVSDAEDTSARVEYISADSSGKHDYAADNNYKFKGSDKVVKHSKIMLMSEDQAWSYVTGGLFPGNPNKAYEEISDELAAVHEKYSANVTVPVWYWKNPDDPEDMKKTTKKLTFTVNAHLAEVFKDIFMDIYNHKSKPVINLNDAGFGTWCLRGINWSDKNRPSAHSLGCAIDINPSSGTYNIDGVTYGNAQYNLKMPYKIWKALPESHTKYHVLYDGCPISEIFKKYGFYWGGDWSPSSVDVMHFAYVGDYGGRQDGIRNYAERRSMK